MGKTIRRFNRSEVPKNKPSKKGKYKVNDQYKGMSSDDIEDEDEFEWYDDFCEDED